MDPDANLDEQRRIAARIVAGIAHHDDAERLAELVQALDGWLSRSGSLPDEWNGGIKKR